MAKKKTSKKVGGKLTRGATARQEMSVRELMAHPVVKEMSDKIEALQGVLSSLPEAIGRAVDSAMAERERSKHPPTVTGVKPLTDAGIEITSEGTQVPGEELQEVRAPGFKSRATKKVDSKEKK